MAVIHYVPLAVTGPDPVVLIRSSAYASLPSPGNRVNPTDDEANMPTIVSSTGNSAIKTATGAHHYRLVGLNIRGPTTYLENSVVTIGNGETSVETQPRDIVVDRCLVRGDATVGSRRGIRLDGVRISLIDSYVADCIATESPAQTDAQGVSMWDGAGPVKVVNNYIEASTENLTIGGADPAIDGQSTADVEIRHNYFFKPTAYEAGNYRVKNHIEFKFGKRVLIEGNVFENTWGKEAGQNFSVVLINLSQNGDPATTINDITVRYNLFRNIRSPFNLCGYNCDGSNPTPDGFGMSLHDNLAYDYNSASYPSVSVQILSRLDDVDVFHNTFVNQGDVGITDSSVNITGFRFQDNIVCSMGSGWLNYSQFTSPTFTSNVIVGGSGFPSGNYYPANIAAISFEDSANDDYRLSSGSSYKSGAANDASDGLDMGADVAGINTRIANVVTGQRGAEDTTSTYTGSDSYAVLPLSFIDTTYYAPTGNVWTVTSSSSGSVAGTGAGNRTGCSLAYALANCEIGDDIQIDSSLTITGSFTLRNIA